MGWGHETRSFAGRLLQVGRDATGLVGCVLNVMPHAQKPDFVFRQNGRVHFNPQWRQFGRLLAAVVCASAVVMVVMLDTPCSEVMWRVLATHPIRQFYLHFLSHASPCAITLHRESTKMILQTNVATNLPEYGAARVAPQKEEWKRNVMAHAQKPDLVFQRNGRVHLYRRGCQFSRLLAAEVCASAVVILDRPCSHTVHECWLPTPFASFPFTSPPVLRRVPSDSVSTLPFLSVCL